MSGARCIVAQRQFGVNNLQVLHSVNHCALFNQKICWDQESIRKYAGIKKVVPEPRATSPVSSADLRPRLFSALKPANQTFVQLCQPKPRRPPSDFSISCVESTACGLQCSLALRNLSVRSDDPRETPMRLRSSSPGIWSMTPLMTVVACRPGLQRLQVHLAISRSSVSFPPGCWSFKPPPIASVAFRHCFLPLPPLPLPFLLPLPPK